MNSKWPVETGKATLSEYMRIGIYGDLAHTNPSSYKYLWRENISSDEEGKM